ncbi:hypothetical protein V5F38_14270 [Xanthobacter sp. V0B-10]|uniref:hypothetical protein n=1 Tax=Xanthobacter albus TaxID=3119929 RepID=UPI00372B4DC4
MDFSSAPTALHERGASDEASFENTDTSVSFYQPVTFHGAFRPCPSHRSIYDDLFPAEDGEDVPWEEDGPSEEEAPSVAGATAKGDQHNAHVIAYMARRERCQHLATLTRALLKARQHLDGSPGCTRMGFSEEWCSPRWSSSEEELLALPDEPLTIDEFQAINPCHDGRWVRYPSCTLPWWGWPPVFGHDDPVLFRLRVWQGAAMVRSQIAEAGGLDDDHGWISRPTGAFRPEWWQEQRNAAFMLPSERAAAATARKKTANTEAKRRSRAAERVKAGKAATPKKTGPRPVVIQRSEDGDFALVPLTRGYTARLPAADAPLVEGHDWHVCIPGPGKKPFARRLVAGDGCKQKALRMDKVEGLTGPVVVIPPTEFQVS